jgi:hypothetical protein
MPIKSTGFSNLKSNPFEIVVLLQSENDSAVIVSIQRDGVVIWKSSSAD